MVAGLGDILTKSHSKTGVVRGKVREGEKEDRQILERVLILFLKRLGSASTEETEGST